MGLLNRSGRRFGAAPGGGLLRVDMRKDERVMSTGTGPNRSVFVALVLVAFNLRLPLTSVPTVITDIHATTGYGEAALGALTTLPILAMGALAFVVPGMASRFGPTRVVWFAVGLLAIASSLRLGGAIPGVMPLTALLAGCAIALAGGCVPGIVRDQLPHHQLVYHQKWHRIYLTHHNHE